MKIVPYLMLFLLTGCNGDVMEFTNLIFPSDKVTMESFNQTQFEPFIVSETLVEPRIMFSHVTKSNQKRGYYLGLIFHSASKNTSIPVVESAELFINKKRVNLDFGLKNAQPTKWRVSPYNEDLYVSSLEGNELFSDPERLGDKEISISISLKVKTNTEDIKIKEIHSTFSLRKRSRFLYW